MHDFSFIVELKTILQSVFAIIFILRFGSALDVLIWAQKSPPIGRFYIIWIKYQKNKVLREHWRAILSAIIKLLAKAG